MAATRKAGNFSLDSNEFDAEFEKFMNEPLSDDSHPASPRFRQRKNKLELSSTQESIERAIADELSTTVTVSDSLSPTRENVNLDQLGEENNIVKGHEIESYATIAASEINRSDHQREGYMTDLIPPHSPPEAADYNTTLRISKDDTIQDSHNFPAYSLDGMDTLEELADKERFFSKLAADASGTLDFAKLNKALDEIQSDHEKSNDPPKVLPSESVLSKDLTLLPIATQPEKDAGSQEEGQEMIGRKFSFDENSKKGMLSDNFDEKFRLGMAQTSSEKDFAVNVGSESQHSVVSENDSETPPSDSLKSIKEVAKARIKEAKERTKARASATENEKAPGVKERKSSSSKLPRPFQESTRKATTKKEIRTRRGSSQRSTTSNSANRDSAASDSSAKSSPHPTDTIPYKSVTAVSDNRFQFSEDFIRSKTSDEGPRASKPNPLYSAERELPSQRINDVSRELQLQSELYELRSDYSRVLEENEKLKKDLERVSKLMNENDIRLKYEFELEQLNQKNATLEKQLKKAKELRIRRESDEEHDKEASKEILQLKKELQEQELLLNGYQLENERLFKEVKRRDNDRKQLQSTLMEENQRLKNSLAESEAIQQRLEMQLRELQQEREKWEYSKRDKNEGLNIKEGKDESFNMKEDKKMLLSLQEDNDTLRREIGSLKDDMERSNKECKDLERQNNEMKAVIKRRYPDSVPSILGRVDTAPNWKSKQNPAVLKANKHIQVTTGEDLAVNSKHLEFLQKTIKRLEKELDAKDEETTRLLAASQQRFKEMSAAYESHINGLQKQLHQAMVKQQLLEDRERTIMKEPSQNICDTNDELGGSMIRQEGGSSRKSKKGSKAGARIRRARGETGNFEGNDDNIPGSMTDRALSPIFTQSDDPETSVLHKENVKLKLKIDRLQIEYEEMRVKSSATIAKLDADCSKIRLNAAADAEELKRIHENEMEVAKENLMKYEQTISKLQDDNDKLEKKLSDHDLIIERLKEKSLEARVDKELLQAARLKEEVLQNQVKLLQKQLKDAIECQPPSQQRINHIEMQISTIQQHQIDRESELYKLSRNVQPNFDSGMNPHGIDWGKIVKDKDEQIKQFREELDEILQTLHSLYATGSAFHEQARDYFTHPKVR